MSTIYDHKIPFILEADGAREGWAVFSIVLPEAGELHNEFGHVKVEARVG